MASGRSIRFKISTLLVIPLVSLIALWGFAASTTSGEALNLLKVETIWTGVINNADGLVGNLQTERLASAELIAGTTRDTDALAKARAKVDNNNKTLRARAASEDVQSVLTQDMKTQLQTVFAIIDRLPDIRQKVNERRLTPGGLVTEYAKISDEIHLLYSRLTVSTDLELALQAQGVIAASEVRELLAREHALIIASNGRASTQDINLLAGIDNTRSYLFPKALANLDTELRTPFEKLYFSPRYVTMENLLENYVNGQPLDLDLWRSIADQVQKELREAVWRTGDKLLARMEPAGITIVVRAAVAGLLGLIAVVFSIFISIKVGRRLTRELGSLRRTALHLAEIRLPDVVSKLRKGEIVDIATEAPPIDVGRHPTSEVADLATAFDSVQSTAVDAAVEQARLREGVSEALRNLARRSQSLLQRQLRLLDEMQRQTEEPEALERLFKLDHLTTRMRRHAEGLVLLSGGAAGRRWRGVIPMEDVLSGAAAQVEEYTRVRVYPMPEAGLSGSSVADLMHLFAELIENATAFSSPSNEVSVRGEGVGRGFAVEIEDRGLGMDEATRRTINERLASPPEFDPSQTERLGFAVVGMLAARHGVKVTLKPSPYGGTTAIVLVPAALVEPMAPTTVQPIEFESVSVSVVRPETTGPGELPRRVRTSRRATNGAELPQQVPPLQAQDEVEPLRRERPTGLPQRDRSAGLPQRERPPTELPQRDRTTGLPQRERQPTGEQPVTGLPQRDRSGGGAGLPRRERQTSLPQRLREAPAPMPEPEERSPEEARALLSSLQSGWQRGRQECDQDGGSES
ncbi:Signal transduction histidine kinase [Nonomuraea solani]|uniref:histidine kinase n=1 Tax=Nonomuraea solani TaxID=1144553 RepID=A0A1H6CTU0_9ACTN|nr:nitrate- and nitrite sensing domain-containing protein [Nonomuraea solani]SEG76374.1 Signal transduction histidine kinase [Nonomuraea solani]